MSSAPSRERLAVALMLHAGSPDGPCGSGVTLCSPAASGETSSPVTNTALPWLTVPGARLLEPEASASTLPSALSVAVLTPPTLPSASAGSPL